MRPISIAVLVLSLVVSACASDSQRQARSWLDERTAVTATAQEPPAILAREDQMRAMNVRDYVEIGAIETNRVGNRRYYLLLVSWSTIDRTDAERAAIETALAHITLWADDRPLELKRLAVDRAAIGLSHPPYALPTPAAVESWYPIDLAELRSLAAAATLRISAQVATGEEHRYNDWQNGSTGFANFLEYVSQPH